MPTIESSFSGYLKLHLPMTNQTYSHREFIGWENSRGGATAEAGAHNVYLGY